MLRLMKKSREIQLPVSRGTLSDAIDIQNLKIHIKWTNSSKKNSLSKLTEETENMKNLIFIKESKSDLKFFPQRKSWPKNVY